MYSVRLSSCLCAIFLSLLVGFLMFCVFPALLSLSIVIFLFHFTQTLSHFLHDSHAPPHREIAFGLLRYVIYSDLLHSCLYQRTQLQSYICPLFPRRAWRFLWGGQYLLPTGCSSIRRRSSLLTRFRQGGVQAPTVGC